ncbi:MAG: NYN domain-containing protein [Bacteroidetes bacterium]|nr:NYN domain-containing protein [Bacteroidota bacterium]
MDKRVQILQSVAILVDGNNMEISIHDFVRSNKGMLNFDTVVPKLLNGRGLNRLIYFREGKQISQKLAERLHTNYYGTVVPCYKGADIPITIEAIHLSDKVDTIILMSGDSDYIELVKHLKSRGNRVEIASFVFSTSKMLVEESDYHHVLTNEDIFIYK